MLCYRIYLYFIYIFRCFANVDDSHDNLIIPDDYQDFKNYLTTHFVYNTEEKSKFLYLFILFGLQYVTIKLHFIPL